MHQRGLSLLELLITISILAIVVALAVPSFSRQIQNSRLAATAEELRSAIQLARTTAVSRNQRVTLRNLGSWELGWEAFTDSNSNGVRDDGEQLIFSSDALDSVSISWNDPAGAYVSFIGTGASRRANGALQMGTFTICQLNGSAGYNLVLAPSGRLRTSKIDSSECTEEG